MKNSWCMALGACSFCCRPPIYVGWDGVKRKKLPKLLISSHKTPVLSLLLYFNWLFTVAVNKTWFKVCSHEDFFPGFKTPWTITFDPWGFRAYVIHKSCWKTYALTESAESVLPTLAGCNFLPYGTYDNLSADSYCPKYCQPLWYNMFKVFHVSFALISGLKDEPYDDIIIVHVSFWQ